MTSSTNRFLHFILNGRKYRPFLKRFNSSNTSNGLKASSFGKVSSCSTDISASQNPSSESTEVKVEDDEDDMEDMFVAGPGPNRDIEWG